MEKLVDKIDPFELNEEEVRTMLNKKYLVISDVIDLSAITTVPASAIPPFIEGGENVFYHTTRVEPSEYGYNF